MTEVAELYPVLGCLERFALERSGPFPPGDLRALHGLLRRFPRTLEDPAERIRCDAAVHARLTSRCPNAKALDLLESLRAQARRYEWLHGGLAPLETSAREHERIVDEVEGGRLARAGRLLERHHLDCIPRLQAFVHERERSLAPLPRRTRRKKEKSR